MDFVNVMIVVLTVSIILSVIIYQNIYIGKERVNLDGSIIFLLGEAAWNIFYIAQLSVMVIDYKLILYNATLAASAVSVVGFFIFMQSLTKGSVRFARLGYALLAWPAIVIFVQMKFLLQGNQEAFVLNPVIREFFFHNYLVFSGYTIVTKSIFIVNFMIALFAFVTTLLRMPMMKYHQRKNILMLSFLFLLTHTISIYLVFSFESFSLFNSMIVSVFSMFFLKLFIYSYISNADMFNMMMVNRYELVDKIQDSVLVIDEHGMILDYNRSSEELLKELQIQSIDRVQNFFSELKKTIPDFDIEKNRNQIIEYALELPDGDKKVWEIEVTDISIRQTRLGNKKDLMFFIKDVTQSYKQELDFMKYKAAFYSTNAGILIVNKEGLIEEINPGFTRLTGYNEEDVLGKSPRILQSGVHPPEYYKDLWDTINAGKTWVGRLYNIKKDGSRYWERSSISPIISRDGEITHYMGIKEDITKEKEVEDNLKKQSMTDYLTGIYNRRTLMEKSTEEFIEARENDRKISVLMMDLDNFKTVNDTYGHSFGDEVLKRFAKVSIAAIRRSDVLGRYGGEEFMITLPGSSKDSAVMIAERIRESMGKQVFEFEDQEIFVTVSIGVATIGEDDTLTELIERADKALYDAKSSGRNRVVAR